MELHINKRKAFDYIDYIEIGNCTISPVHSEYGKKFLLAEIEVENGEDIEDFVHDSITEVQLRDVDGEEILLHGDEILNYFTEIEFYDDATYYNYDVKGGNGYVSNNI